MQRGSPKHLSSDLSNDDPKTTTPKQRQPHNARSRIGDKLDFSSRITNQEQRLLSNSDPTESDRQGTLLYTRSYLLKLSRQSSIAGENHASCSKQ